MLSFWLILSGHFDFFHISLGVISIITVLLLNSKIRKYEFFAESENKTNKFKTLRLFSYLPFMIWDITISSFKVAYLIIHPKMPLKTVLIKFKTKLPNMTAKVLLGNSITLTPGTLTLQIKDDEFLVHSLTSDSTEVHVDQALASQIAQLYGMDVQSVVHNEEVISSVEDL